MDNAYIDAQKGSAQYQVFNSVRSFLLGIEVIQSRYVPIIYQITRAEVREEE
jgi:hypothetical protein